jgi:hypothetical protein
MAAPSAASSLGMGLSFGSVGVPLSWQKDREEAINIPVRQIGGLVIEIEILAQETRCGSPAQCSVWARRQNHQERQMSFKISALPADLFAPLYGLSDDELARRGIVRKIVDEHPGFPCRVSLADAGIGEKVLLLNYEHQPASSPYRATHAIFVREGAKEAHPKVDEVPAVLRRRLLSVRAFDEAGMMLDADAVSGDAIQPVIERLFADDRVAYLHLHNAKPGCYAARVDRA